jgi:hypothetical protein
MTPSLISELDDILRRQDWYCLHREGDALMVAFIEHGSSGDERDWHSIDVPIGSLRHADLDRLNRLIADIEKGQRIVHVLDGNTYKESQVPAGFWWKDPWVIYRGPRSRGSIGQFGSEWFLYEPKISDAKPQLRRGRKKAEPNLAELERTRLQIQSEWGLKRGTQEQMAKELKSRTGTPIRQALAFLAGTAPRGRPKKIEQN